MMQRKIVLQITNPFLLDASTYISTAVMALLGMSGLNNLALQLIALLLCLTFALLYHFLFRSRVYERNPVIYFGSQAVVLSLLLLLRSDANDAFTFLFYILTVHATVVFTVPVAAAWVLLYFMIASAAVLFERGTEGLFAVFFYLAAFFICAILGRTVQQTELTSLRNQKLLQELKETQQKLQELAVLEERNRLARDLHDSVKQQVFAISMQLSAARMSLSETDKALPAVVEAERLAQQAGTELTTLIHELRPPGLDRKTLATAIRELVDEFSRQNKIETTTEIDSTVAVDLQTEQAMFRVLQESLANVLRHSKADRVAVTLKSENDAVILTVEDNGIGFDEKRITKGIGLDSMQERLLAVNGTLEVSSHRAASPRDQAQGTSVTAIVRRS